MSEQMPSELSHNEYRLDLGGAVIAVHCEPAEFAVGLANWFGRPSAQTAPHVRLDLELVPHADSPRLPNSLITTKTLAADGSFDIADGLITGHFDGASGRGRLRAKGTLIRGPLMRILEQIFYQAFWSARESAGLDAFLIHSSAVIAGGLGFLFVGPSEAGKSTVARLSAAHHVLGDEMNLVRRDGGRLVVEGTLFNGLFKAKRPGQAPLAGVFLLRQAPQHALSDVPLLDGVTALAAEIVPPVGLDQVPNRETLPRMMDLAESLADNSTLKFLEFLPDEGFWPVIAAEFGFVL
jgi:hypothetical protein